MLKRQPLRFSRLGGSFSGFDPSVARRQCWGIRFWGILFPSATHLLKHNDFLTAQQPLVRKAALTLQGSFCVMIGLE